MRGWEARIKTNLREIGVNTRNWVDKTKNSNY